jgi:subtilisin family serine protease
MNRLIVSLSILLAAPFASAATSRYVVLMRAPLHGSQLPILNDVAEGQRHDIRTFKTIDAFAADLSEAEVETLRASREVRVVEPLKERHINDDPTPGPRPPSPRDAGRGATNADSPYTHQVLSYGVEMVNAPAVWSVSRGEKTNLAIIDTGVDMTHPDLVANYAGGYNTFTKNDVPRDDHRHGTHVAGIVGAEDNDIGVAGVAPRVKLWAVKVLDNTGFGDNEHIAAGIDWVITKKREIGGNWIISASLGAKDPSDVEQAAVKRAVDDGILFLAAAGNNSFPALDYPAAYNGVMGIGAIDSDKVLARFTNTGPAISVVAPGVAVLSTVPVGTSFIADVQTSDGGLFGATPIRGSPRADVEGAYIFCGLGRVTDIPSAVAGKIAVVRRGEITFNEKVRNAKALGAKGVVVLNRKEGPEDQAIWTAIFQECNEAGCHDDPTDLAYEWPVMVGMGYADGEKLLERLEKSTLIASYRADDYARFSGTSMATPHVSASAALLWSLNPTLSAYEIRRAIEETAQDLGTAGFDPQFGHGVVDVLAAAKRIAPEKFGLQPAPPRRRGAGH